MRAAASPTFGVAFAAAEPPADLHSGFLACVAKAKLPPTGKSRPPPSCSLHVHSAYS